MLSTEALAELQPYPDGCSTAPDRELASHGKQKVEIGVISAVLMAGSLPMISS
jgi:hypothetical protein